MARIFIEYLGCDKVYNCKKCWSPLVAQEQLVSKNFHGKTGKAYLFERAYNLEMGAEKEQLMMTGLHRIRSVKCKKCKITVGWTYVFAYEESEKYKEGKFIIERHYLAKQSKNFHAQPEP